MARTNQRSRNNNPEGRNQYSSDWMTTARDRPVASAAVAAAAVGAGVFLWSRRDQISNQLSQLSDQIGHWTESMQSSRNSQDLEMAGGSADANFTGGSTTVGNTGTKTGTKTGQSGL
jgi:hypothetical protein